MFSGATVDFTVARFSGGEVDFSQVRDRSFRSRSHGRTRRSQA
jgi:hypothetical protein